jgi:hypothetical protein
MEVAAMPLAATAGLRPGNAKSRIAFSLQNHAQTLA